MVNSFKFWAWIFQKKYTHVHPLKQLQKRCGLRWKSLLFPYQRIPFDLWLMVAANNCTSLILFAAGQRIAEMPPIGEVSDVFTSLNMCVAGCGWGGFCLLVGMAKCCIDDRHHSKMAWTDWWRLSQPSSYIKLLTQTPIVCAAEVTSSDLLVPSSVLNKTNIWVAVTHPKVRERSPREWCSVAQCCLLYRC